MRGFLHSVESAEVSPYFIGGFDDRIVYGKWKSKCGELWLCVKMQDALWGVQTFETKLFCDHSIRKLHKRFSELDNFVLVLLKFFWFETKAFYDFTRFSAVEIAKPQSSIQKSHKNVHKCVLRSSALLILKVNGELQDPTETKRRKKIPNTEKNKIADVLLVLFPH